MKASFRESLRGVMRNAWRIYRVTGDRFAECLRKAWRIYKLYAAMRARTVQFFYKKVNGETRQAFGTLMDSVIHDKVKGSGRPKREDLFTYWDTEKGAFRSFKKYNLVGIA